jgi:hypothetical protein
LKIFETSVGANLHVTIERQTLANPQMQGESDAEYGARSQGKYAKAVKAAVTKGERIGISVEKAIGWRESWYYQVLESLLNQRRIGFNRHL